MLTLLYRTAAGWTALGLASGLFYREFTKANNVDGGTQLAVVHTHTLVLGTIMSLVLLGLVAVWRTLATNQAFRTGVWVWQAGLALTTGGMIVKGCRQVLGDPAANSSALAGISGLGHMTLTVAFVLLFIGLGRVVRADERSADERSAGDQSAETPLPAEHATATDVVR